MKTFRKAPTLDTVLLMAHMVMESVHFWFHLGIAQEIDRNSDKFDLSSNSYSPYFVKSSKDFDIH